MTQRLKGYIRANPGGAAVTGVNVNLIDMNTGVAPVTNSHTNLSSNTTTTDGSGMFQFTFDLNPCGPMRVEADLTGGNIRHRRADEVFLYDGFAINRLPDALAAMGTGVIRGSGTTGDEFNVTASATRVLTIAAGMAVIKGFSHGWGSGTKTLTGTANGSAGTTRRDLICLRQWYNGVNEGKQDIVLVAGTAAVSPVDPVVTAVESDLTQFIQGPNIWDLPIARATLAAGGTVYTVAMLYDDTTSAYGYVYPYFDKIPHTVRFGNDLYVDDDLTTRDLFVTSSTTLGDTGSDVVNLYGHIETQGTSPNVSTAASDGLEAGTQSVTQGTDTQFTVTGTTKSPPIAGEYFVITFNSPRSTSNYGVWVTARTSGAAPGQWFVQSKSTTGFTIRCQNVLGSAATITLDVLVI